MSDLNLTQAEANALMAIEKHRADTLRYQFPITGSLIVPLQSPDRKEQFLLDIARGRIDLQRAKFQNRARQVIVLARLDLAGPPHRNPDGEEVATPHLHLYRAGYGDKWAVPVPPDRFGRLDDAMGTLEDFMRYCRVTEPPYIERGLFS